MTNSRADTSNAENARNTVCMHYVLAACQRASDAGLNREDCLSYAGLQPDLLSEPQARISALRYETLVGHIASTLNDELLMLGGVSRSRIGCFNLMCQLAIHEPTLRQAILRCIQFYNVMWGDIRLKLSSSRSSNRSLRNAESNSAESNSANSNDNDSTNSASNLAYLSIHFSETSLDYDNTTTDCTLVLLHRFLSWLVNKNIPLHHVSYTCSKPDHYNEHNRLFRCPIEYSSKKSAIVFSKGLLNLPVCQTKESLGPFLKGAPGNLMVISNNKDTLAHQIRMVLTTSLHSDPPSLEKIAEELCTTAQTIRRKLKKENTSYQEIKDQLRQDSAINFLCNTALPINEISLRLGFSEPSTFHRAFKKWTGTTPGTYRRPEE